MRKGLLATLTCLLAGPGFLFAQHDGPLERTAGGLAVPAPAAAPTLQCLTVPDPGGWAPAEEPVPDSTFWGSAEYLLWWFRNGHIPPLVTAGGNGVIGAPGTQVLVDNLNFDDQPRQGGRFALGYQLESAPDIGIEAAYFFLPDGHTDERFASSGAPILGQPYVNAVSSMPAATLLSAPGIAAGSVAIGSKTSLWGTEANLTASVSRSDTVHLTALAGFRFLNLEDEVTSGEQFRVAPSVPGFGGSAVVLQDEFRTTNRFYGGQVGLEAGMQFGRLTIDWRGRVALGDMNETADVSGATNVLPPNGTSATHVGGLYALATNIGRHQRDELACIPEVGLNVGLQVTSHLNLYAGYSFLWISNVARAGEQIDPVVNISQFPIRNIGPLVGPARPAFPFDGTSFWAQGLSLGLEVKF